MRPVDFFTRSNSSVGAEKEISPQHPSHACSWPEPQLSEKMLMQALSVFSERRHALFKPASVWRGGGSSLPHHPFHCSHPYSSSGLSVCSSAQDWHLARPMGSLLPPARHVPTPWCRSQKIEFSPLLRLFWRSTIKYGSPFTHFFQWKVTKVKWLGERASALNGEACRVTFNSGWRGVWIT